MSAVLKRSVTIRGHRTSISLEAAFFEALGALARRRHISLATLVTEIDADRSRDSNLCSALRTYVLKKAQAGELSADDRDERP